MNLKDYYNYLRDYNNAHPISCAAPQPAGINTLWVPQWSRNRTAALNINHQVNEFDEARNMAYGENGNCMTPYTIIEVPMWLTDQHLQIVAEILCKEIGKPADYPTFRVLKAERIEAIKRIISTLPVPTAAALGHKTSYMSIINNTAKTFSPAEQQAIHKAMADYGVDKVTTHINPTDGQNDTLFDFYDENENYLFSIDTDADGDCVIWNKA